MFVETYSWGWMFGAFWVGAVIGFLLGFACAVLIIQRFRQEQDTWDFAARQVDWGEGHGKFPWEHKASCAQRTFGAAECTCGKYEYDVERGS